MKSSLKNMIAVLFCITLISSAAVGVVYELTKNPIQSAKEKKLNKTKQDVLPDFDRLSPAETIELADAAPLIIYTAYKGDNVVGYAVESSSKGGYSGEIKLLIGFNANGTVNKIKPLSHAETPGLGAKIDDSNEHFVKQFEGLDPKTKNMSVTKDGGDLDAITASTITSRAYIDAVNAASKQVQKRVEKK